MLAACWCRRWWKPIQTSCQLLISEWRVSQLWRALPMVQGLLCHSAVCQACAPAWIGLQSGRHDGNGSVRSICWHSGQQYVINADFTLHWVELALIATSPLLIYPLKPSLFIYHNPEDAWHAWNEGDHMAKTCLWQWILMRSSPRFRLDQWRILGQLLWR